MRFLNGAIKRISSARIFLEEFTLRHKNLTILLVFTMLLVKEVQK